MQKQRMLIEVLNLWCKKLSVFVWIQAGRGIVAKALLDFEHRIFELVWKTNQLKNGV